MYGFSVYIAVELAIAVLAILGNVLVCWAVWLNSNLQNVTNYFVASLAAADIAVGVLAVPFAVTLSTGFCAACHSCLFFACFVLVLTQSSIFSLLAIAIDRYIAIRIPLRYNGLVTGARAKGVIAVCWVLSFAIGLTPMLGWNNCSPQEGRNGSRACGEGQVACLFEDVVPMGYMVYYNFLACVLLPLLLMLGVYLRIFLAARRQLEQTESQAPARGPRARSTLQKEVHAAKSLAIIVGLFALCWLPLHVINCFTFFCPACGHAPPWLMYLTIVLSHGNSVVNPFIYAYRIREFRHTFRRIVRSHVLRRRREPFKAADPGARALAAPEERMGLRLNGHPRGGVWANGGAPLPDGPTLALPSAGSARGSHQDIPDLQLQGLCPESLGPGGPRGGAGVS